MAYRYTLETYKGMASRYTCPSCRKPKTFSRYIDTETGNHIADHVGKCSREVNCAYHYTPKQFFEANKPLFESRQKAAFSYTIKKREPKPLQPACYVPLKAFKDSLHLQKQNCFFTYLNALFGAEKAAQAVSRYFIGTSNHWDGATIFWQIDSNGKIRAGKIMLYNPENGKRIKEPYNHITWVHSALKLTDFELKQCLFGEHLLKADRNKPCALVESEKTAVIASVYLPQFIWLAVGSLSNLNSDKCQVLKGRSVTLFPDLNGFEKWQTKAKELSRITRFAVSDLLERKATEAEREKGLDLADYLIRFPLTAFHLPDAAKSIEAAKAKPSLLEAINIDTNDIERLLGQTSTGSAFGRLIIAGVKTKAGKVYDLLFDKEGQPIEPEVQQESVTRLAAFFCKEFHPASLNGQPCLIHIHKN